MKGNWTKQINLPTADNFLGRTKARLTSTVAMLGMAGFAVVTSLLTGGSANAWGPTRETFTMEKPASYVTFDSIINNPDWGDERGFTLIKDVTGLPNDGKTASGPGFGETAEAVDGNTYMVKMFIHNNAAANLNLIAKNTRLMAYLPTASGTSAQIQGMIAADNCGANQAGLTGKACAFWDEAYLKSNDEKTNFTVSLVEDSVRYYNNVKNFSTDGFTLDGQRLLSSEGTKVGYELMDGNLQGCFQYSGYATFLVKVAAAQPSFTLTKQLRVNGGEWGYTGTAQAGDTVEYRINYQNVGQADQDQVVLKDTLAKNISVIVDDEKNDTQLEGTAAGLNYVAGSTMLYNATTGNDGAALDNDTWTTKGLNIGNYTPSSNAIVTYKTTVPDREQLQCGANVFENAVIATTAEAGSRLATTQLTVQRDCSPVSPDPVPEPGAPSAGISVKTAVVSLGLFLACAATLVYLLAKKRAHKN